MRVFVPIHRAEARERSSSMKQREREGRPSPTPRSRPPPETNRFRPNPKTAARSRPFPTLTLLGRLLLKTPRAGSREPASQNSRCRTSDCTGFSLGGGREGGEEDTNATTTISPQHQFLLFEIFSPAAQPPLTRFPSPPTSPQRALVLTSP